uniref:hypothetical protein n=1 Tax=Vogesella mureinivorans TaxID=657276 RepID=UPI001478568B
LEASKAMRSVQYGSAGIASALEAFRSKDLATALEASKAMRSVQYGSAGIASALEAFRSKDLAAALEASKAIRSVQYGLALDTLKPSAGVASALEAFRSKDLAAALEASKAMRSVQYGLALDALKPSAGIASALEAFRSKDLAVALEASKAMRSVQYGLALDALKPSAGVASALEALKSRYGLALEGFAQPPGLSAATELSGGMSNGRYGLPSEMFHANAISSFGRVADLAEPVKRLAERDAAYHEWKEFYNKSIRSDGLYGDCEVNAEAAVANFFNFIFGRPNISDLFNILSDLSWFVSLDLRSRLSKISSLLARHDQSMDIVSYVGAAFESVYEESILDLSHVLMKRHSHRAEFIQSAVRAHKNGDYELSVPIFLIQADGVAHDVDHELFSNFKNSKREGYRPNVNKIGESESGRSIVDRILWSPLSSELPIVLPGKKWKGGLNRNMVLHGHDCSYATKENSLKAFSFLSYVSSLLSRVTH